MMHDGGWWHYVRYDEKQRAKFNRALLRRVASYARPYNWRIVAMLGTILTITLLGLVPPALYKDLIDNALGKGDLGRLNLLAIGMIGIPLINGAVGVLQRYLSARIGEGVIFDLRCGLFEHMQRMSLRFFTNTKTGELMSRLNNDVVGAQQAITSTLVSIVSNAIAVISTLAIMLYLDWRLALVSVAVLPLFVLPARRVGNLLREVTRDSLNMNAQMNALMNETLNVSGALLVKIFGRSSEENVRFGDRARRVRDIGIRQALIGRWFFVGLSLVSAAGTAIVFWVGGHLVLSGAFTVGVLVQFGMYVTQLYGPLSALTNARVEFATSMVSFERVFEVLDLPEEITDRPGALMLNSMSGSISFEDVSFSYQEIGNLHVAHLPEVTRLGHNGSVVDHRVPREHKLETGSGQADDETTPKPRWALRHVSFQVRQGQLAALVGPSGAGKTTATYLLPRLYDPTEGRILVDGHDLRDVTLKSLSQQIGMVTQETYLFHDTLRENLLYARPNATTLELEDAARIANLSDVIANMPDGLDTIVGERGYRLSGGEKQRVAIARVILKDPRILILDEATSHLDSQSEALIQAALERVMRGRTGLVIAHRLSTILSADLILVMDRGRLVESGTHASLLERAGLYARLYKTQFRRGPADADRLPTAG